MKRTILLLFAFSYIAKMCCGGGKTVDAEKVRLAFDTLLLDGQETVSVTYIRDNFQPRTTQAYRVKGLKKKLSFRIGNKDTNGNRLDGETKELPLKVAEQLFLDPKYAGYFRLNAGVDAGAVEMVESATAEDVKPVINSPETVARTANVATPTIITDANESKQVFAPKSTSSAQALIDQSIKDGLFSAEDVERIKRNGAGGDTLLKGDVEKFIESLSADNSAGGGS